MIKIYYLDITNKQNIDLDKVPDNARDFVRIYKEEKSRNLSGYAWMFLKDILNSDFGIDLEKKMISYNKYGKPYIDGMYFNISHSNNMIAIAISDNEVGIDIEAESNFIRQLDSKYFSKWLSENELIEFNLANDKLHFLAKTWTKKEAILKFKGIGIQNYKELKNIDGNTDAYEIEDEKKEKYVISVSY